MLTTWIAGITMTLFIILFAILWMNNAKKLYTFNDVPLPPPESLKNPIINPVVYQLVYVSSSGKTWTILYDKMFLSDWKNNRINYLLINGTLYNIEQVNTTGADNMVLTLEQTCGTMSSFGGCTDSVPTWSTHTVLYVLGYRL